MLNWLRETNWLLQWPALHVVWGSGPSLNNRYCDVVPVAAAAATRQRSVPKPLLLSSGCLWACGRCRRVLRWPNTENKLLQHSAVLSSLALKVNKHIRRFRFTECTYITVNLGPILFVEGQQFVLTLSTKLAVLGEGGILIKSLIPWRKGTMLRIEK